MEANVVSLSSEFPNDNFALHRGAVWVCLSTTGSCEAELPRSPVPVPVPNLVSEPEPLQCTSETEDEHDHEHDPEEHEEIVIEELDVFEAHVEGPTPVFETQPPPPEPPAIESELPPPSNDAFVIFVSALADVAISAGSSHVAALLPSLLFDARVADEGADEVLRGAGLWNGETIDATFVETTHAWRAILRGTSDDFDACGTAMLDEWGSDLLARLLATPAKAQSLRQELRSRGVAAFGIAA